MIDLPNIVLDLGQKQLVDKLNSILLSIKPKLFQNIFSKNKKDGIYIHGSVGSGKSMISKAFFDAAECKKLFIHYQDLMQNIHKAIHSYSEKDDLIKRLATEYSSNAKLLCIDEFEIKDIADAMIIGRLFSEFKKQKVFILITTNTAPDDLYKDGLQRSLFLPFIDMINKEFDVFNLDNNMDYRMLQIASAKRVLYPLTSENKKYMNDIIHYMVDEDHFVETKLKVFGREVVFPNTYKTTLVTSFDELCNHDLSYNDYIEICKYFSSIIMKDVPIIDSDNTNVVIRFINFIDNVYINKNLLFISLEASPQEIYIGGERNMEFKRTVSRLHEIESDYYFKNAKK